MKKTITETIRELYFEDSLKNTIRYLLAFQDEYTVLGYTNLVIEYGLDEYYLVGDHLETDKEYENRIDKENILKLRAKDLIATKDAAEKKLYETLKEKYESK